MLIPRFLLVLFMTLGVVFAGVVLGKVAWMGLSWFRDPSIKGAINYIVVAVPVTVFVLIFGLAALDSLRDIVLSIAA